MRLYTREGAGRPPRVAWALEEAGAPYEIVRVPVEDTHGEEHRRRHPLERVPVLEDDDGFLFESAAICLQVADTNPQSGLIAANGTRERALAYQWVLFAMSELEPTAIEAYRFRESDPERSQAAMERFLRAASVLDDALAQSDHLIGESLTVADVVVASVLAISRRFDDPQLLPPRTEAYLARMEQRPARVRAYAAFA
ncbi:MAG TPA: glutathione S-transferase family protein [Solirubrobacteraceae bacterium]